MEKIFIRKYILVLILFVLSSVLFAQIPRIDVNPQRVVFGDVVVGEESIQSYQLRGENINQRLLINSDNNFFTISLEEQGSYSRELTLPAPNDDRIINETIYVRFAPERAMTYMGNIFHFTANYSVPVVLHLRGRGVIEQETRIVFEPEQIDFGSIMIGEHSVQRYQLFAENIGRSINIGVDNPFFALSLEEQGEFSRNLILDTIDGSVEATIFVRFSPLRAAQYRANVVHRSGNTLRPVLLPINGIGIDDNGAPQIVIEPESISFGEVMVGGSAIESYRVTAENVNRRLVLSTNNPFFAVSLTEDGRFSRMINLPTADGTIEQTVYVRFAPLRAGDYEAAIYHRTMNSESPVVLPLSGTGMINQPQIVIEPESISFEEVMVGDFAIESYRVTAENINRRLVLSTNNPFFAVSLTEDGRFSRMINLPTADGTIEQTVYVRFAPLRAGDYEAAIYHRTMNVREPLVLYLSGTSIEEYEDDEIHILLDIDNEHNVYAENSLLGNYPNPFNPETAIQFVLKDDAYVNLSVYNTKGQKVKTLLSQQVLRGYHTIKWDGKDNNNRELSSGVYLYIMEAEGLIQTGRMLLLK